MLNIESIGLFSSPLKRKTDISIDFISLTFDVERRHDQISTPFPLPALLTQLSRVTPLERERVMRLLFPLPALILESKLFSSRLRRCSLKDDRIFINCIILQQRDISPDEGLVPSVRQLWIIRSLCFQNAFTAREYKLDFIKKYLLLK